MKRVASLEITFPDDEKARACMRMIVSTMRIPCLVTGAKVFTVVTSEQEDAVLRLTYDFEGFAEVRRRTSVP